MKKLKWILLGAAFLACAAFAQTGEFTTLILDNLNGVLIGNGTSAVTAQTHLSVSNGGTGLGTLTSHAVQVGAGTSTPTQVGPSSTTGAALVSAGASADPAYSASAAALVGATNAFTAIQHPATCTLTDASTITWASNCQMAKLTLTGSGHTLGLPGTLTAGTTYEAQITQAAGGGDTLSFNAGYKWPGGTAPTITTTASAVDLIACTSFDGTTCDVVWQGNFH